MIRLSLIFLVIVAGFSSCLKNDFDSSGPRIFSIKFNESSIKMSDVDSAVFVLNIYDTTQFATKRLTINGSELQFDITSLPTGFYYLGEVAIYAKSDTLGKKYQYYYPIQFDPQTVSAITLPAPTSSGAAPWYRRLILEDEDKRIAAMIPLNILDPYFEIKAANPFWNSIEVERDLYYILDNVNTHTNSAKFECAGNCFINGTSRIINRSAFREFATSNSSAIWNKAVAKFTIKGNNPDDTIILEHSWDR